MYELDMVLNSTLILDLSKYDDALLTISKPKNFNGNESVEIRYDKQFASSSLLVQSKTSLNIKTASTFQYYNALETLKSWPTNK
jgi:hypothetical protein